MLFNYWTLISILLLLPLYYSLTKLWQNIFLLAASYAFYCYWDYRFLLLIIITTILNFFFSMIIHSSEKQSSKVSFLVMSLVFNLGMLGFFKYYNFFITSFYSALKPFGIAPHLQLLNLILPLGISFYTFKIIGYLIDIYRGDERPADILPFAVFVSYFPEISAGPIGRAHAFFPQIREKRLIAKEQIVGGLQLILLGYFKKNVIADVITSYVDPLFSHPEQYLNIELLCGMYLYTLQIYADFSGYTDIVRGISKLLGIDIMENFRQPYLSRNINEFWRRWHISLSTWLRDYLYIPLGGNRKGIFRTYIHLLMTMLLCGLWHGASWVFVAWGCIHGVYLAMFRYLKETRGTRPAQIKENYGRIRSFISIFLTFHLVGLAWIFFRSPDLSAAFQYIYALFNLSHFGDSSSISLILITIFYMSIILIIDVPLYLSKREFIVTDETPWPWRSVVYALLILGIAFIGETYVRPFIYFQF
jgi:alginate O-acetyltransferase complex protein AlgI